ncbi:MAG: Stk1 family PASTA domain-containing Ser/Thr kinase [Lachnospiraceae bacterium]|nr:Stk1 family PASTA domain-containing Ser/Thr kinase [Lachnospiraceae bacterium]
MSETMILSNRYEILSRIGSGGMSDVFKAIDTKLNRNVAVKILKAEYAENTSFVSKFRAEAQSAAGLMHPNIVNVYDVGEDGGLYYIVMELVEGITLKHYIEKKLRLTFREAVSIAIQVSMGIESAHNNHIIHRDIKPQNIIISKDGKVKVTDFGIARAASSDTITSNVMGSVHYTSPEQARGGYSDEKSDIYSLGIVLFEMVTGRVPFDGDTAVSLAIKHIQEDMPSPREYVDDIPISVEHIIYKCCEKNPDRRYYNMSELVADLKRALVKPDEDFVQMIPMGGLQGATKMITDDDMTSIRQQTGMIDLDAGELNAFSSNAGKQKDRSRMNTDGGYYGDAEPDYPEDDRTYADDRYVDDRYAKEPYDDMYPEEDYQEGDYRYPEEDYSEESDEEYYARLERERNAVMKKARKDKARVSDKEEREARSRKSRTGSNKSGASKKSKPKDSPKSSKKSKSRRSREDEYRPSARGGRNSRAEQDFDEYDGYDDEDMEPGLEKLMTILGIVAAIIIVVIIVVLVGRIKGLSASSDTDTEVSDEEVSVELPEVKGLSFDTAKRELENMGLTVTSTTVPSAEVAKGNVVSVTDVDGNDLKTGDELEEGTTVILLISSGDSGSSVPDVTGLSQAEAKVTLENAGFVIDITNSESDSVEAGNVISQNPTAGSSAEAGSTVIVVISSGKGSGSGEVRTVPDIKGMNEQAAKTALTAAGLSFTSVTEENSDTVAAGLVISQSPEAGTTVEDGSSVDFVLSLGPAALAYGGTFNIAAPPGYVEGTAATLLVTGGNSILYQSTTTSFPVAIAINNATEPTGLLTVTYTQSTAGQENDDGTFTQGSQTQQTTTQALTFTQL